MHIRTVGEYLKRWCFMPQKPVKRAYEQNPKTVKRWLEEDYPGINAYAKTDNAETYWIDEMGMSTRARRFVGGFISDGFMPGRAPSSYRG
jgi:hypothetical protein